MGQETPTSMGPWGFDWQTLQEELRLSALHKVNNDELAAMRDFFERHPKVLAHFAEDIRSGSKSIDFLYSNLKNRMAAERRK